MTIPRNILTSTSARTPGAPGSLRDIADELCQAAVMRLRTLVRWIAGSGHDPVGDRGRGSFRRSSSTQRV